MSPPLLSARQLRLENTQLRAGGGTAGAAAPGAPVLAAATSARDVAVVVGEAGAGELNRHVKEFTARTQMELERKLQVRSDDVCGGWVAQPTAGEVI